MRDGVLGDVAVLEEVEPYERRCDQPQEAFDFADVFKCGRDPLERLDGTGPE